MDNLLMEQRRAVFVAAIKKDLEKSGHALGEAMFMRDALGGFMFDVVQGAWIGFNVALDLDASQVPAMVKPQEKISCEIVSSEYVQGKIGRRIVRIETDDILYLKADSKCVNVVSATDSVLIAKYSMAAILSIIPGEFVQIHRNAVVRKCELISSGVFIDDSSATTSIKGTKLSVSRDRAKDVRIVLGIDRFKRGHNIALQH